MEYKDYYATLGVPRTATPAQIKKAFRSLARKHHPDVNKGDAVAERRFKEVSEAHEVLADPEKRKLYDQLGADWESYQRAGAGAGGARGGRAGGPGAGPFAGFGGFGAGGGFPGGGGAGGPGGVRFEFHGDPEDLEGFSDFFRTFFAGGAGPGGGFASAPGGPAQGRAGGGGRGGRVAGAQEASLEEMLAGLGGARFEGDGQPLRLRQDAQAEADISLEEAFHGTRRRVEVDGRRLDVSIPRGVDTGRRIRLSGKAGSGPDAGDLYLRVTVRPHPVFARSGTEMRRELRLTLGEALLGGEVPVQSLKGRVLLNIPAGTQNGRVFRLKGQGMPRFGAAEGDAPAGDMLVTVRVVLPTDLDEEAKDAGRRFIDLARQPDPRA